MDKQTILNLNCEKTLKFYNEKKFINIEQIKSFDEEMIHNIKVVGSVIPFRVNQYVIDELIDWSNIPDDPIFQLTFPQKEMLSPEHFLQVSALVSKDSCENELKDVVNSIRKQLNPHPSGQRELNVPNENGKLIQGMQHKYRETVLFFPTQGQTCHSYCTFCFRWAQFVGDKELRFASTEVTDLQNYIKLHDDITDVIFTGGDPMVMKTHILAKYLEALLEPGMEHIQNIRIGTKALTYWPQRFVTDDDADDLLVLFEKIIKAGKSVSIMAHYNHWRELETNIAQLAIHRLRQTSVVIRSQAPVLAHINDSADIWARLWKTQVRLGIIPYYMFVERDTGPKNYFEIPLEKTWKIYQQAIGQVSGLGRTARGPTMSATPGKVIVEGITEIAGNRVFVLKFLQARNRELIGRPFFAKYSSTATWFDQLEPAFITDVEFFKA